MISGIPDTKWTQDVSTVPSPGIMLRPRTRLHGRAAVAPQSIVLLAGGSGLLELSRNVGRSILDLPVADGVSVWTRWEQEIERLLGSSAADPLDVRIVGGAAGRRMDPPPCIAVDHRDDPAELRGTGGILRDLTLGHSDDDYILVASAATLLLEPLAPLVQDLYAARSDVAFFVDDEDVAANLMLIRCGCLRSIPEVGFVDLKEQALPRISSASSVTVLRRSVPVAASMRTVSEYIRALREYHLRQQQAPGLGTAGAFAEGWQPAFRIIEGGAQLGAEVTVHDSVVLAGSRVGRGSVLVRSVIGPGAVVPPDSVIVDRLVHRSSLSPFAMV